ncbi:MAG: T9SS type A sorting domain-containing protein [Chitinivibrionales bacterium]|nr:T9SS type A sorting domain-containing protein [Chitinivibrionales bacterium]
MRNLLKLMILCLLVNSFVVNALQYSVNHMKGQSRISDAVIQTLMKDALNSELNKASYYEATINVYAQTDQPEYWVVLLSRSDIFWTDCYRLDIENSKVTKVTTNYVDTQDYETTGECPDPNIEFVSSCSVPEFATCVKLADDVYQVGVQAGLKSIRLPQKADESLNTVLGYMKCPKLKIWHRVGHGTTSGLMLGDGKMLKAANITGLGTDALKGKIMHFTSCLAHTGAFEQAILTAKAKTFVSGDITVQVGKIEKVSLLFIKKIINDKKEIKLSMSEALKEGNYPGSLGISGNGPWYFWDSQTAIAQQFALSNGNSEFTVSVMKNRTVSFYTALINNRSNISIYTLNGQQLYKTNLTDKTVSWDMTTSAGNKLSAGSYIASLSNGSKTVQKTFSVVK